MSSDAKVKSATEPKPGSWVCPHDLITMDEADGYRENLHRNGSNGTFRFSDLYCGGWRPVASWPTPDIISSFASKGIRPEGGFHSSPKHMGHLEKVFSNNPWVVGKILDLLVAAKSGRTPVPIEAGILGVADVPEYVEKVRLVHKIIFANCATLLNYADPQLLRRWLLANAVQFTLIDRRHYGLMDPMLAKYDSLLKICTTTDYYEHLGSFGHLPGNWWLDLAQERTSEFLVELTKGGLGFGLLHLTCDYAGEGERSINVLKNSFAAIKPGGFLIACTKRADIIDAASGMGYMPGGACWDMDTFFDGAPIACFVCQKPYHDTCSDKIRNANEIYSLMYN